MNVRQNTIKPRKPRAKAAKTKGPALGFSLSGEMGSIARDNGAWQQHGFDRSGMAVFRWHDAAARGELT